MKKRILICLLALSLATHSQNAIQFNGVNSYVAFGNNSNLGLSAFTLECWFKRLGSGSTTSTGTGGVTGVPLITKGRGEADGSNVDMNYFLGIRQTDSTLVADFEEGASGTTPGLNHPIVGATKLARNTWYHVAVTYDGSTWKLYLNGMLESQVSVNQPVQNLSIQHSAIASALTSLGAAQGYFNGIIDEVRIWNAALSQTVITSNMNSAITSSATNLVARWGFEEGTGTTVSNSAGATITGTLINTNWSWVTQQAPFNINLPPNAPVMISPADSSKCAGASVTLSVSVSDMNGDSVWVKFYGRKRSNAKDFSIIPLPDTQYYTGQLNGATNKLYKDQMNWVVAKKDSLNIKFISGLGDCVENGDNGNNDVEWKRADTAMKIVETQTTSSLPYGIPYGFNVGNHDQSPNGNPSGTTTFFNQYFGTSRFNGRYYWGGNYGTNADNSYQLFTAEGIDFIVINLEYDVSANSSVLTWANGLMQTYSNRRAIVSSHYLLDLNGSFGAQGLATYNALKNNSNFFLMLCGHVAGESRRSDVYNGKTVHCVMSDYQGRTNGGNGWIRIMKFRPSIGKINVYTYSPSLNQSETDGDSQFILDYDFGPAYTLIDSMKVASGQTVTTTWNNLLPSNNYQWYVKVSDGNATVSGSVRNIQTRHYKAKLDKDTVLCGGPLALSALSGTCGTCISYSWMTGSTSASISVVTSTQAILSVVDSLNCQSKDTINIGIIPYPVQPSIINGTQGPCTGLNMSYSVQPVTGAASYTWSIPGSWSGSSSGNTITLGVGTQSGVISVVAGNTCGVSSSRTLAVIPNLPPVLSGPISGSTAFCVGSGLKTYSISAATGASSYTWSIPSSWTGTVNNNLLTSNPGVSGGLLSVIASNSCGTSATQTINIIVNTLPTVVISAPANTLCYGTTLTLNASGANTYTWSTSSVSSSISISPSANTAYSVNGSDANGCANTASVSLTVLSLPSVSINGSSQVCSGATATLTGSGAATYTWNTSSNAASLLINPTITTQYSLAGTGSNGCSNSAVKTVTVFPLPQVSITGPSALCSGAMISLVATGANSYTWSNSSNSNTLNIAPASNTTYTLTGEDLNSCINVAIKTVTVNPLPIVSINGPNDLCAGQSVTLTANGAITYSWNTNAISQTIVVAPLINTMYMLTGVDIKGCTNQAIKTVTVKSLPLLSIQSSVGQMICAGEQVSLSASGAVTYTWSTSQSGSVISVAPNVTTVYTVTGTSLDQCDGTALLTLNVSQCTGIDKNAQSNNIRVYPNPNMGEFYIENDHNCDNCDLVLYDVLGKVIHHSTLRSGLNSIKTEEGKGMYFYKISNAGATIKSGRIVIE
jgi:hypothetical protein